MHVDISKILEGVDFLHLACESCELNPCPQSMAQVSLSLERDHLAGQSVCLKAVILQLPNAATFNTVPHVVESPNYKIVFLSFQDCNFSTVMNQNLNISDIRYLIKSIPKGCVITG